VLAVAPILLRRVSEGSWLNVADSRLRADNGVRLGPILDTPSVGSDVRFFRPRILIADGPLLQQAISRPGQIGDLDELRLLVHARKSGEPKGMYQIEGWRAGRE
jgi:hypothetical protein